MKVNIQTHFRDQFVSNKVNDQKVETTLAINFRLIQLKESFTKTNNLLYEIGDNYEKSREHYFS